jgi:hypothetical protein
MNPPATTFTFCHTYGRDGTLVVWHNTATGIKPADKPAAKMADRNDIWILFMCITIGYFTA